MLSLLSYQAVFKTKNWFDKTLQIHRNGFVNIEEKSNFGKS